MALDKACFLKGREQAVGGHLAACASLGELPDRPGFLWVVGDQLRRSQTSWAQCTPASWDAVAHAFGQRLARKPSPTRAIHKADVGILQTCGRCVVQHGLDHHQAPTVSPVTLKQPSQLAVLDDPDLHGKGLPGNYHSGLRCVTDHIHIR